MALTKSNKCFLFHILTDIKIICLKYADKYLMYKIIYFFKWCDNIFLALLSNINF